MIERQYCASSFILNDKEEVLLMYNRKLHKWLQPGGHIEGIELPHETAVREALEETGWQIEIVNQRLLNGKEGYQPLWIENYINKVGDMIDIQFQAIPIRQIKTVEKENYRFFSIEELKKDNVDDEIIEKVKGIIQWRRQKENC